MLIEDRSASLKFHALMTLHDTVWVFAHCGSSDLLVSTPGSFPLTQQRSACTPQPERGRTPHWAYLLNAMLQQHLHQVRSEQWWLGIAPSWMPSSNTTWMQVTKLQDESQHTKNTLTLSGGIDLFVPTNHPNIACQLPFKLVCKTDLCRKLRFISSSSTSLGPRITNHRPPPVSLLKPMAAFPIERMRELHGPLSRRWTEGLKHLWDCRQLRQQRRKRKETKRQDFRNFWHQLCNMCQRGAISTSADHSAPNRDSLRALRRKASCPMPRKSAPWQWMNLSLEWWYSFS